MIVLAPVLLPAALSIGSSFILSLFGRGDAKREERNQTTEPPLPTSQYGNPIEMTVGAVELPNRPLVWALPLKRTVNVIESSAGGGKGGGGTVTTEEESFSLSCQWIIGDPFDDGGMVQKIYLAGKLVYDATASGDDAIEKSDEFAQYMTVYDGSSTQSPSSLVESVEGTGEAAAWQGWFSVLEVEDLPTSLYGQVGYPKCDVVILSSGGDEPDLSLALEKTALDAGLTLAEIANNVSPRPIKGAKLVRNGRPYSEFLESLQKFYFFGMRVEGGVLEFFDQERPNIAGDVPLEVLGAVEFGDDGSSADNQESGGVVARFEEIYTNEEELPTVIFFEVADWNNEFQPLLPEASMHSKGRRNPLTIKVPVVSDYERGFRAATRFLAQTWLQSKRVVKISCPPAWGGLRIGEVYRLPIRGYWQPIQITKRTRGANLLTIYEGVYYGEITPRDTFIPGDPEDLEFVPIPEPDDNQFDGDTTSIFNLSPSRPITATPEEIQGTGQAEPVMLDVPLISNLDFGDQDGIYFAIIGDITTGNWQSGALYSKVGSAAFQAVSVIPTTSTTGIVSPALPPGGFSTLDEGTEILVTLDSGRDLEPVVDENFNGSLSGGVIIVGAEIIQYKDAQLVLGFQWRLSKLKRGLFNTQDAIATHQDNERFVLLRGGGAYLGRITSDPAVLLNTLEFKAAHTGQSVDFVTKTTGALNLQGISRQPYPPAHLQLWKRFGDDALIISWIRQARVYHGWRDDGVQPPLDELVEKYKVDVYDSPGFTVLVSSYQVTKAELSDTRCEFEYTAAQQIQDFGSVQSVVSVKISQFSQIFGWGYESEETLTINKVL